MNSILRKLLASASVLILSSPTLASEVHLYGVADAGVSVTSFGQGRRVHITSGAEDGSRIGVKGKEDLGSGYKALFTLEARVEFDTGLQSNAYLAPHPAATLFEGLPSPVVSGLVPVIGQPVRVVNNNNALFDRQAFLGLITPVGAILLGRQYTPAYEVAHGADAFESGTAGSWFNLAYINGSVLTPSLSIRDNNALQYRIEAPNGIIASAMWAPESTGSLNVGKRAVSGNLIYRARGIDAGVGYHSEQNQLGQNALETWTIGGSYQLQKIKLFAGYLRATNDNPALAYIVEPAIGKTFAAIVGQNARVDSSVFTVGLHVPLASGRIKAGVSQLNNNMQNDADAMLFAVGYDHFMSKRTNLYATLGHAKNESRSQAALGGSGYAGGSTSQPGTTATAVQLGIRHNF
jgi:predicted porin